MPPRFVTTTATDLVALSASLDAQRRDLTPGQRAVAAAEAWGLAPKNLGGGKGRAETLGRMFGVNNAYVSQARAVLLDDPVAAEQVKAGLLRLPDAYAAVVKRREEAKSEQFRLATRAPSSRRATRT